MAEKTPLLSLSDFFRYTLSITAAPRAERTYEIYTLSTAVYGANWKSQFLSGMMQPLMNIIGNIAYVAVCVFWLDPHRA